MNRIEDIGKQMPYRESKDYVDTLVSSATEQAIRKGHRRQHSHRRTTIVAIAAAIAALLVFVGISQLQPTNDAVMAQTTEQSPVDDFLNTLSDDEVQLLAYYEVEEVAEYQ